jgi:dihydrofolate reductase
MYVSLDSVMEVPEQGSFRYWTDDHEKYAYERLLAADALLLGRRTYETFAEAWPRRHDDAFADRITAMTKHVVSSTLADELSWNNSHVLGSAVVSEVRRLKDNWARTFCCTAVTSSSVHSLIRTWR